MKGNKNYAFIEGKTIEVLVVKHGLSKDAQLLFLYGLAWGADHLDTGVADDPEWTNGCMTAAEVLHLARTIGVRSCSKVLQELCSARLVTEVAGGYKWDWDDQESYQAKQARRAKWRKAKQPTKGARSTRESTRESTEDSTSSLSSSSSPYGEKEKKTASPSRALGASGSPNKQETTETADELERARQKRVEEKKAATRAHNEAIYGEIDI